MPRRATNVSHAPRTSAAVISGDDGWRQTTAGSGSPAERTASAVSRQTSAELERSCASASGRGWTTAPSDSATSAISASSVDTYTRSNTSDASAASMVHASIGRPPSGRMFLRGSRFDPPRAGMTHRGLTRARLHSWLRWSVPSGRRMAGDYRAASHGPCRVHRSCRRSTLARAPAPAVVRHTMTTEPPSHATSDLPRPASALDADRAPARGRPRTRGHRSASTATSAWLRCRTRSSTRSARAIDSDLLTHYPSLDRLYDELSAAVGVERDRLLLTAGSDAAVKALYQVYAEPGAARRDGRTVVRDVPDLRADVRDGAAPGRVRRRPVARRRRAPRAASATDVRLVFIANPNQPTGTVHRGRRARGDRRARRRARGRSSSSTRRTTRSRSGRCCRGRRRTRTSSSRARSRRRGGWRACGSGMVAAHPEVVRNLYKVRSAYDVNAVRGPLRGRDAPPPRGRRRLRRRGRGGPDAARASVPSRSASSRSRA